jgi:hypothetical protein
MRRFCHFREKRSSIATSPDPAPPFFARDSVCRLRFGPIGIRIRLASPLVLLALAATSHAQDASTGSNEAQAQKKCDTLQRRIVKEQSSLESFDDTLTKDKKGREACSTKPMCARYDHAIKTMEARKVEHEQRLAKFKADAEAACKRS